MSPGKILPPDIQPRESNNILHPRIGDGELLLFNFKHLDKADANFNFPDRVRKTKWYCDFLDKLRVLSDKNMIEMFHPRNPQTFRFHPVRLRDDMRISRKTFGIMDSTGKVNSELDESAYQFSISRKKGRVIGYIIKNVFFVVWLDRDHECYS